MLNLNRNMHRESIHTLVRQPSRTRSERRRRSRTCNTCLLYFHLARLEADSSHEGEEMKILYRPPWAFWYTKMYYGFIAHVGPLFIEWRVK